MSRIFAILLLGCTSAYAQSRYTEQMFRRALTYDDDASLYALITLHDQKSGSNRLACVEAPFILGSLNYEHHFQLTDRKTLKLALSQPGRAFAFTNPEAIVNIEPTYSEGLLARIRQQLASTLDSELAAKALALDDRYRTQTYRSKTATEDDYEACRDAIGHILLEHGIMAGEAKIVTSNPAGNGVHRLYIPGQHQRIAGPGPLLRKAFRFPFRERLSDGGFVLQ